jgi:hypothetical protein
MNILNKKFTFAVGFVIYKPDYELIDRIKYIIDAGIPIFIFDNSPENSFFRNIPLNNGLIRYFTMGSNVGLGQALKLLCATAYVNGFEKILYFDQDTKFNLSTLEFIDTYSKKFNASSHESYAAVVFSANDSNNYRNLINVNLAISSGSLFILSNLDKIGWHNHNFFVDCVDYEFCIRARRFGYKIGLISNTPGFDHISGQPDTLLNLFNYKILVRNYSSARIKDSLLSYLKLLTSTLFRFELKNFCLLLKSLFIYILGQFLSRLTSKLK